MKAGTGSFVSMLLAGAVIAGSAQAIEISVPVDSITQEGWVRSDGGIGTSMTPGGPAVWNTRFVVTLPAEATAISFKLDGFLADDKGVVHLNGVFIADAAVTRPNGTAAGPGTFDFGLGAGNLPYTFVGYVPGTAFPILPGTTTVTVLVYMNDTGTPDPSAPPLAVAGTSGISFDGAVRYDDGRIFSDSFEDNPP